MRILTTRLLLLSAVFTAGWACALPTVQAAPPPLGVSSRATVLRVIDGDTIECEVRYVVQVRLLDCYAPETRTKDEQEKLRGQLATRHMERLAKGAHGTLFVPTQDARTIGDVLTLGRVLGHFWVDESEQSLSELMVESGYATREESK